MTGNFYSKITSQYQLVTSKTFTGVLLAWEFDPDLFKLILSRAREILNASGVRYDLLQARAPDSPEKMLDQGFNLSPKSAGNDWSHLSIGFFNKLESEEFPSILNMAKGLIPTYKMLRISTLPAPASGLDYLVIDLDAPTREVQLKKALHSRYEDFFTSEDKGFSLRPHVSILGFKKEDMTKVKLIIPELNKLIQGKTFKPKALQLWEKLHVVKHIAI